MRSAARSGSRSCSRRRGSPSRESTSHASRRARAAAAVDAAIASSAQGADIIGRLVDEARLEAIRELG